MEKQHTGSTEQTDQHHTHREEIKRAGGSLDSVRGEGADWWGHIGSRVRQSAEHRCEKLM